MCGIGRNRSEMGLSLSRSAHFHQGKTKLIVGIGVGRLHPQHFLKARNGLFSPALALIKYTEVVLGISQIGIEISGSSKEDNRRLQRTLLISLQSEVVHAHRLMILLTGGALGQVLILSVG
ncbi:MAG: hypothetical protein BWY75_03584 [bacterium ADurb.Bin425]|nr:MAG: hypothetical protein BWY75_03584 [bacterium ADurb.Bin425]